MNKQNLLLKNSSFFFLFLLIISASLWGAYKSIYYGCDIDESYAISLSYRLINGDHLFKEMWEVHQTSSLFMAPFIYLFSRLHSNLDGIVIFVRFVGIVIQFLLTLPLFYIFRKFTNSLTALLCASLFFNFSPKYLSSPEFCVVAYWTFTASLIAILYYLYFKNNLFLFIAGINFSLSVLAYPYVVVVFPVFLFLFFMIFIYSKKTYFNWKSIFFFSFGAFIVFLFFMVFVLSNISLPNLISNIPLILQDHAHKTSLLANTLLRFKDSIPIIKTELIAILVCEIIHFIYKKIKKESNIPLWFYILLLENFLLSLKNFHSISGVQHIMLSFVIYYIFWGNVYAILRFHNKNSFIMVLSLIIPALSFGIMTSISSNLELYANGGLLMPGLIFSFLVLLKNNKLLNKNEIKRTKVIMYFLLLTCLFFFAGRIFLVRFTALQPKNIFDTYYEIAVGPAKGIKVIEREHIEYHSKLESTRKYVTPEDTFLYIGNDLYMYLAANTSIGTQTTISTPGWGLQNILYYKKYPYKMPTVIIADTYYFNELRILDDPYFGTWLKENYDVNNPTIDNLVTVFYIKEEE